MEWTRRLVVAAGLILPGACETNRFRGGAQSRACFLREEPQVGEDGRRKGG